MNRTAYSSGEYLGNPEKSSSSTIRRTIVEHGIRPVENDNSHSNGQSATIVAITNINKQHEDEQRELQELNTKLSTYLDHVQKLENRNADLAIVLDDLKQKWGGDAKQVHAVYGPQLQSLRSALDNSLRDQAHQELQLKGHEYDIEQTHQHIAAFDSLPTDRLNVLQQELNMVIQELAQLNSQFDRRSQDLIKERANLGNFLNELDGLQTELVNHRLERTMVENELQTYREQMAFDNAIYQVLREEMVSVVTPIIDISQFYRHELARAISDIRQDFDILAQSQLHELEEYYRMKTEHTQQELVQENERKQLLSQTNETLDKTSSLSSLADPKNDYQQLQNENNQLQVQLYDMSDDLERIREEHLRDNEVQDRGLHQLREELAAKQEAIDGILGSNISLRFELTTYGRLLNSEEQRLNRLEQEQPVSTSSYQNQIAPIQKNANVSVQKMAIKKSTQGPITFDSIDFVNDCILITYDSSTGGEQSLENWTVRHENDQQTPKVYTFPSSFVLRPRQTVRIFSQHSPQSVRSGNDVLIADQIDTWGQGQVVVTHLIDANNGEKASITHTRVPA